MSPPIPPPSRSAPNASPRRSPPKRASAALDVAIVRNGSRGLFWLEPLVEVETAQGRLAYGPIAPGDVASLFDAGFLDGRRASQGARHATEDIAYLKNQQRMLFARCGIIRAACRSRIIARHGGLKGLRARACNRRRRRSSKRCSPRACAGAAARAFRPASNGAPSPASRPTRNTSSATPTKATAAHSPTAC